VVRFLVRIGALRAKLQWMDLLGDSPYMLGKPRSEGGVETPPSASYQHQAMFLGAKDMLRKLDHSSDQKG
jgi:hypothetical protein